MLYDHWIFHVLGSNNKMRILECLKKMLIFQNQKVSESLVTPCNKMGNYESRDLRFPFDISTNGQDYTEV